MAWTASRFQKLIRQEFASAPFMDEEPLRVFAFAMQHQLKPEVRLAAKLSSFGGSDIHGLDLITGLDYARLQIYHKNCCVAASAVAKNLSWFKGPLTWI